jgi:hypothetical protein
MRFADRMCGMRDACAATPRPIVGKEMNVVVEMIMYITYLVYLGFEMTR